MEKELTVNGRAYRLIRLLGKGKGGYSYLAESDGAQVVVKQIHHEPCDYYTFGNKIEAELRDYERLQSAGIRIPEMREVDIEAERIVKDYIEGPTVMELVDAGESAAPYLPQVRDMAAKALAAGLNIDYYPTNFVVRDGLIWYIDYECNEYSPEWDFEHWGIKYWLPEPVFKPYCDSDYEAVCDFLIELNRADRTHINWNWARFEWMMEHPEFDKSARSAIGLWRVQSRVIGAAIYDMYFGEAFCGVLPEYSSLYPEIIDYARRAQSDENGLSVALCDGAERAPEGFLPIGESENIMRLSLEKLKPCALPEGYSFCELDPGEEPYEFQWLLWRGFDHGEDRAEFEARDPIVPQKRPHLNRSLSLAALSPEGGRVAYACVWYSEKTDYAYVEPVCTAPAHRGRGIAAALVTEALRRARALGAREAFVISDLAFYERLGFESFSHYTFFRI
ncbi:MAG: GNAT family N-acetyltransferase [Oscillospiraceae bacterium]|nr:GNAT family N-acetyltransferase [Oscillospiraceae bacterium]